MRCRILKPGLLWLLLLIAAPAVANLPAPDALREEAMRHENGDTLEQDFARAYDLYCLAALQGDAAAAYRLGALYLDGLGRVADSARAAGWFKQAAKLGAAEGRQVLESHLATATPATDPNCPLVTPQPERVHIKTWVYLLAPYYKINPDLVLSVIQVESNFNARAKSPKDAYGLMQLILPTAKRFGVKDVWDPLQNIKGGMAYLSWLKEHFSYARGRKPGRIRLMLAAYNAGEDAVKRHRGIPPYDETRKYVKRIVRIYARYIKARRGLAKSTDGGARKSRVARGRAKLGWKHRIDNNISLSSAN